MKVLGLRGLGLLHGGSGGGASSAPESVSASINARATVVCAASLVVIATASISASAGVSGTVSTNPVVSASITAQASVLSSVSSNPVISASINAQAQVVSSPSVWTPQSFSGNVLHLRSDAGTTLADGDTTVDIWADQSGNGNDASAPAAINRPLYVENALNGKPVVRGDGVSERLSIQNSIKNTLGDEYTVFIVEYVTESEGFASLFKISGDNVGSRGVEFRNSGSGNFSVHLIDLTDGSQEVASFVSTNNYEIVTGRRKRNDVIESYVNGFLNSSNPSADFPVNFSPSNPCWIFYDSNGGRYLGGDIAEIIVYNRAFSASERQQTEQYLSNKYAITLA